MTTPFPQVRAGLHTLAAVRPVRIDTDLRRRLVLGNTLHTDLPPRSILGRIFGLMLTAFGQANGYPCIAGGAGRLAAALVERAAARGVEFSFGERVDRVPRAGRAVIAAVDIWQVERLLGTSFGIRPDPATLKVDWTLDGPIPWTVDDARRSPVVHLGDESSFVLFGQYSMADPTRSPAGKETAWAYSHVLNDVDAIEAHVERHAPGFRALVRGRHVQELRPGCVNGGTARRQLVLRPRFGRPELGDGVYLGSMSAHPGGGVSGAPGWIAAQAALRAASRRRERGVESLTISST
jgi:phytoene dehydrogenase-like protein